MVYFFYYIPVGINTDLRKMPVLTYAYAGLCVLVFALHRFAVNAVPFDFIRLAYFPDEGNIVTAITATFLHVGYFHLIGNLVYLGLFGRYVEDRLGSVLFTTTFVGCAAFGNLVQGMFDTYLLHTPTVGIIGASGAVSGVLGAFLVRFIRNKLRIAYWVFMPLQAYTRAGNVELPVVFALVFWFLMEFIRGAVQAGGFGADVAYAAHVSGFLLGVAVAAVSGQAAAGRIEAHFRRGVEYMRGGEPFAAQGEYLQYLTLQPGDPDAHAGLARAMALAGDFEGARRNYRISCELLIDAMRRGDSETIYQEAVRGIDDFTLGPGHQLGMAFGLERDLKPKLAVQAYEMFAAKYPSHRESAFALLRAAGLQLSAFSNSSAADTLYERLLADYPNDTWAEFAREQRRKLSCQPG